MGSLHNGCRSNLCVQPAAVTHAFYVLYGAAEVNKLTIIPITQAIRTPADNMSIHPIPCTPAIDTGRRSQTLQNVKNA